MRIVTETEDPFAAPAQRKSRRRAAEPEPVQQAPAETAAAAAVPVLPLPPAPGAGFEEDRKYRGMTTSMDKVLDALHRDGWSLGQLYKAPRAMLPLPEGRFPPGRSYLFSDNVAVVVNRTTGGVITSLPVRAALRTLQEHTPEVLTGDAWASQRWAELLAADPEDLDAVTRYHKQTWYDRSGSVWTVKRVYDGARIYRDGTLLHTVADADAAEDLDLHPILVEFVDFVITER